MAKPAIDAEALVSCDDRRHVKGATPTAHGTLVHDAWSGHGGGEAALPDA